MADILSDDEILALRFDSDAGDGLSIREYFHMLLWTLWDEGEGFSAKRPFGNSGWEYDLYKPLLAAGAVPGSLDDDGYVQEIDTIAANALVFRLIGHVFGVTREEQSNG
jgi:hypothetical protein